MDTILFLDTTEHPSLTWNSANPHRCKIATRRLAIKQLSLSPLHQYSPAKHQTRASTPSPSSDIQGATA